IIALSLSWYGVRQAERPATIRMTFGYHRIGVVIAIVNALSIFAIAVIILFEAYNRFQETPEVQGVLMTVVAAVGLAVNIIVALWLRHEQKTNINIRSAFWHASGDALASIGVIFGGLIIMTTGQFWVDPLVSVLISFIILFAVWNIFREGFRVLIEATPKDIDVNELVDALKQIPGVKGVHDIHVWSISPEIRAMNGHILVDDVHMSKVAETREQIEKMVRDRFRIGHTTLQLECQVCKSENVICDLNACKLEGEEEENHKH
ncbi:MAG: cation diffusion facilitator family transporter, partial [Pseudomonadota bacterium]